MQRFRKPRRESELVTTAEIACYEYCPQQWRLEHGQGFDPENQAARWMRASGITNARWPWSVRRAVPMPSWAR